MRDVLSAFPPQFVAGVTAPLAGGCSHMGSIEVSEGHLINSKANLFGDVYIPLHQSSLKGVRSVIKMFRVGIIATCWRAAKGRNEVAISLN